MIYNGKAPYKYVHYITYIYLAQLEQEMDTTFKDEDSSEESSRSEVEIVYQAVNCIICFNLKVCFI